MGISVESKGQSGKEIMNVISLGTEQLNFLEYSRKKTILFGFDCSKMLPKSLGSEVIQTLIPFVSSEH